MIGCYYFYANNLSYRTQAPRFMYKFFKSLKSKTNKLKEQTIDKYFNTVVSIKNFPFENSKMTPSRGDFWKFHKCRVTRKLLTLFFFFLNRRFPSLRFKLLIFAGEKVLINVWISCFTVFRSFLSKYSMIIFKYRVR